MPCANCVRREEACKRIQNRIGKPSIQSMSSAPILPLQGRSDNDSSMAHLEFFHHFQSQTMKTLIIAPEAWESAAKLSFKFDFLMNAILCVAARHLSTLQPSNPKHSVAAACHLCRALSGLRHQVAHKFQETHIDAFIATSLLLQVEVWANPDYVSIQPDNTSPFQPAQDRLFAFCSTLKQVFLRNVPELHNQRSFFRPHMLHNPTDALVKAARIDSATLARHHTLFAYHQPIHQGWVDLPLSFTRGNDLAISMPWHHVTDYTIMDRSDIIQDGYMPAVTRLCLILSYLPEAEPPISVDTSPPLLKEMGRYIMTFPVLCHGPFASMVEQSDPYAFLLLYHFYRATKRLLPVREFWWAQERAPAMERTLRIWLIEKGFSQT